MKTALQRKLLSLFVIFAMVLTLLPAGLAQAATSQYFQFANFSTEETEPTQVNRSVVDLIGTFSGVSANSITYKVEQMVNGQIVAVKKGTGVNPIIENGNTFKFLAIELLPGLNKITVEGINPAGNVVNFSCFVNFTNVPVLYDIKLVDGRALEANKAPIVDTSNAVILLRAPNAKQVTVNGVVAFGAGGDSFIASNIRLTRGLNQLAIVAANDTMKYTLNRQIIYFDGVQTPHEVRIGDTSIDGNPIVGPNTTGPDALRGQVTGKFTFRKPAGALPPNPTVTLNLYQVSGGTTTLVQGPIATTLSAGIDDGTHITFPFTSNTDINPGISANGQYLLTVTGSSYGGTNPDPMSLPFTYRSYDTAYISNIQQLYNVTLAPVGGVQTVTYDSSTVFPNNSVLFELPVWLEAKIENRSLLNFRTAADLARVTLTSSQNGATVPAASFTYDKYVTGDGDVAFRITNLPAGEQTLTMSITSGGGTETKSVTVNYIPAPFIQLNNVYNSKVFRENGTFPADVVDNNKFTTIKGRLVNFNPTAGSPDFDSVEIRINGRSMKLNTPSNLVDASGTAAGGTIARTNDPAGRLPGTFDFIVPDTMKLVVGPNVVTISGTGSGVPVSTTFTLYMFSDKVPSIINVKPVPYDPLAGLGGGLADDINLKFRSTGPLAYVTNEKAMDVRFTVTNIDTVVVLIDGEQVSTATRGPLNVLGFANSRSDLVSLTTDSLGTTDTSSRTYALRLTNLKLPKTGLRSIVIQTTLDSSRAAQTLSVTREISPYTILSPKLPNERVVSQNFLPLAILAEGADQVLIGKEQMVKDKNDIFRYDLMPLKAGINKIKFTVVRGTQRLNAEFEVNYVTTPALGSQFKTTMPKGGSLSVFGGQVSLKFEKGTVLKKQNERPGDQSKSVDLFDSQRLLFGIADKEDGRTVKKTNKYVNPSYLESDPDLIDVSPMEIAVNLLKPPARFGYASNLFWMDAGYFDNSSMTQYNTIHGQHPYMPGSLFYLRADNWMEPSQRGTISIKYDPYIRDVISKKLSVWRFTGNQWINLGGLVNTSRKEVTAPFEGFGYYAVFEDRYSFDDIISHPYARNQLELMFAKGIMNQKDNNEFGVYDNITRGEFATMLVKMLDIPLSYPANPNNLTFDDVPGIVGVSPFWDYRYIETAVQKGIIRGMGPRVFSPNGNLTREQAAVMIARGLNLKVGLDPEKDRTALQKIFTDANIIDYYAIGSTLAIQKDGLITGRPNVLVPGQAKMTYRFDPLSFLNRADASIIAERIMRKLKKI